MVSTHSPTIKLFAENYLAQMILGLFMAFALQQAVSAITNAEKFRAREVWLAVEHSMKQKYSNYPRFDRPDSVSNVTIETPIPINFRDGNKFYESINEAIRSLPSIPARPVLNIGKTELDLWSEQQIRTLAKDLSISYAKNEVIQDLKVKISKEVEVQNETYQPRQYEIKRSVEENLKKLKTEREIAATFLVLFLIIQPWHLYIALRHTSCQYRSACIIENSDTIDLYGPSPPNKYITLLSLFLLIVIILTYAAMNWGKTYTESVLPGIILFIIFWTFFDVLRIFELSTRFRTLKKGKFKAMLNLFKPHIIWLLVDVLLLVLIYFIWQTSMTKEIVSYEQLMTIKNYEILVLVILVGINFVTFFANIKGDGSDKYIHSLEKLSILSDEDETDAEFVAQIIEKTAGERKWLDIGSGNLQKVFFIVKLLLKKSIYFKSIDCLEPRKNWGNTLPLGQLKAPLRIHKQRWPKFIKKSPYSNQTWSMVTLIHSLYQSKITENGLVQDLLEIKSHVSSPGCVLIITEGEGSSLLHVKKDVYKELGGTLVTEKTIIDTTKYLKWPSHERYELNQKFVITSDDLSCPYDETSAFPWFIFESATSSCDYVQHGTVLKASRLLIRNLKETRARKTFLNAQDVALVYRF